MGKSTRFPEKWSGLGTGKYLSERSGVVAGEGFPLEVWWSLKVVLGVVGW